MSGASVRRVGVVTAMPEEHDAILSRGKDARRERGGVTRARFGASDGSVTFSPAQLAMLIEGIDWRAPERTWRPKRAG